MKNKAFTLMELLVVIFIILTIATIAIISVGKVRENSRNTKRVSDVKQIQFALEMYYRDNGNYPIELNFGDQLASSGTTYMERVPSNPNPREDGSCPNEEYLYESGETSYQLQFCTSNANGDISSGYNCATPIGIEGGVCIFP